MQQVQQRGFRDWWQRSKNKIINAVAGAIGGVIGGPLGIVLAAALAEWGQELFNKTMLDFPLTYSEERALNDWIDYQFNPWYNHLIVKVGADKYTRSSANAILADVNFVLLHFAVMRTWVSEQTRLANRIGGDNFTKARAALVNEALTIIEAPMMKYLRDNGLANAVPVEKSRMVNFIANVQGMRYTWQSPSTYINYKEYQPVANIGTATTLPETTTTVTTSPNTTTATTTTQITTANNATTAQQPQPVTDEKSNSNWGWKVVAGLFVGYFAGKRIRSMLKSKSN